MLFDCTYAHEMWTTLSSNHLEQSEDNQHDLASRFFEYRYQPGNDVKTHIADIKGLAHQLKDAGEPVSDKQLVAKIVCTLPPKFHSFISSWRHVPPRERTLATLTSRLLGEERTLDGWGSTPAAPAPTPTVPAAAPAPEAAFAVQFSPSSSHRGRGKGRGKRSREASASPSQTRTPTKQSQDIKCSYCGWNNHVLADCRFKKRHDRSDQEKEAMAKRRREDTGAVALAEQHGGLVRFSEQDYSLVSTTPRFDTRSTGDWFADSGATRHMTDQLDQISDYKPVEEGSWMVKGIGTSEYPVLGFGNVYIWTMIDGIERPSVIKNVLYVPGLGKNLFSIGAITDMKYSVTFDGNGVYVTSNEDELKMMGERVGRTLYLLAIRPRKQSEKVLDSAFASSLSPALPVWHRRLAHLNYNTIIKMASQGTVDGLDLANTDIPSEPCAGCQFGKHQRSPFPVGRTRATHTGQIIHSDLCGPMERATPNGALYYAIFIDDYSGWRFIYFLRQKSEAADCFKKLINQVRGETGNLVRTLRTDNGGEYGSSEFSAWLARKGIRHETSAPHTPQQDGVSERAVRTVTEGARSCIHDRVFQSETWSGGVTMETNEILKDSRLPTYLWGEAAAYTVYTLNRVLCKASTVTPYEKWHNKKPNVSHLRTFGAIAYVHVPKAERKKLEPKSVRCIFVGYSATQKAYRFWDPCSRTVKISRDVTFDEHHHLARVPEETSKDQAASTPPATVSNSPTTTHVASNEEEPVVQQPRRSLRGRIPIHLWPEVALAMESNTSFTPDQYKDAVTCPEAEEWMVAIKEEYDSLIENETWELVRCPEGTIPIKTRWTFVTKPAVNGQPPRRRARLVAKGFSQRPGIDFTETFAPVVTHDTMRIVMSLIAHLDMDMEQLDIKTAFLHGRLDEELYMEQPEGFVVEGKEEKVCRLKKCIYGLKQASRVWAQHFKEFLNRNGFQESPADPCLFIRKSEDELTFFILWVDDGIIASTKPAAITEFMTAVSKSFKFRQYPAGHFVGIKITRDREQRKLYLSQPEYTTKILETFNMSNSNPRTVPADPSVHLTKPTGQGGNGTNFPYRSAVGSLLYLALVTRPDISFAVGQVSRFCESFDDSHVTAVKRIMSYLRGTTNYGICYDGSKGGPPIGYSDADYGGCLDTRRSTTGTLFKYHNGPIAWSSRRQSCVAQSTTEAEYMAASETSKEAIWIRRLLPDLNQEAGKPIHLYCDNQSAIHLTKHPDQRQKTKHIDIAYHAIRERQESGQIDIQYIETAKQIADAFTKPLPGPRFITIRNEMGVLPVPEQ